MAKRIVKNKDQKVPPAGTVQLDVKPDTPLYYINYVAVSHTAYDFTLSAAKIPSPFTPEQMECAKGGKPIPLEATVQLVLPPLLIDGLINALTEQQRKQKETVAQQVKNNELQQQQHTKPTSSVH